MGVPWGSSNLRTSIGAKAQKGLEGKRERSFTEITGKATVPGRIGRSRRKSPKKPRRRGPPRIEKKTGGEV